MVSKEARTKTVADMVDRYIEHDLPFKDHNKDAPKTKTLLCWWKDRLGNYALANVTSAQITEIRDEPRSGKTYRKTRRSPKTCNRYFAALSHCFKIAVKEWLWLNRSPMENVGRYSKGKGRLRRLVTLSANVCWRPAGPAGTSKSTHWLSWRPIPVTIMGS